VKSGEILPYWVAVGAYEVLEEEEGDEEEEDEEDLELGEADEAEHLVHSPRQDPRVVPPPPAPEYAPAPLMPHRSRSLAGSPTSAGSKSSASRRPHTSLEIGVREKGAQVPDLRRPAARGAAKEAPIGELALRWRGWSRGGGRRPGGRDDEITEFVGALGSWGGSAGVPSQGPNA
jgi:hypothetical protein